MRCSLNQIAHLDGKGRRQHGGWRGLAPLAAGKIQCPIHEPKDFLISNSLLPRSDELGEIAIEVENGRTLFRGSLHRNDFACGQRRLSISYASLVPLQTLRVRRWRGTASASTWRTALPGSA